MCSAFDWARNAKSRIHSVKFAWTTPPTRPFVSNGCYCVPRFTVPLNNARARARTHNYGTQSSCNWDEPCICVVAYRSPCQYVPVSCALLLLVGIIMFITWCRSCYCCYYYIVDLWPRAPITHQGCAWLIFSCLLFTIMTLLNGNRKMIRWPFPYMDTSVGSIGVLCVRPN